MDTNIIQLTRGKSTLVDNEDYEFLSQWQWAAQRGENDLWYAVRRQNGRVIFMHHALLGVLSGKGMEADHKNHDTLDNRRSNLRICTRTQNQQNRRGWSRQDARQSSPYKGVSWEFRKGRKARPVARIVVNKSVLRKRFYDEETAARWYDEMATRHFGEFALLNFPVEAA